MFKKSEIQEELRLSKRGSNRLTAWYFDHPAKGSLAEKLKKMDLPPTRLRIHLEAFKKEGELDVYVAQNNAPFQLLESMQITGQTYGDSGIEELFLLFKQNRPPTI